MREKAAKYTNKNDVIKWRSHEPSRIETFSDAAFAFALTLIIVSLEVPKTFDEMTETMKGALSFAICFALLFQIWNNQNIFFRRYGINDNYTLVINAILLLVVLIYTYPLKFLIELLTNGPTYLHNGHEVEKLHPGQQQPLMLLYGAGVMSTYLLFYLMYRHAKKYAKEIELTALEQYETQTIAGINLICVFICAFVMTITLLVPAKYAGTTAFSYFLIGIAYTIWYTYRAKKKKKLFGL
jgi:uncharacterized membrane protein